MYNDRATCEKCWGDAQVSDCCHDQMIFTKKEYYKCSSCGKKCKPVECSKCDGTGREKIEDTDHVFGSELD